MRRILEYALFSIFLTITLCAPEKPGCKLISPPATPESMKQKNLLRNLKNHHLFGERFSFNSPDTDYEYTFSICIEASDDSVPNAAVFRFDTVMGSVTNLGSRDMTTISGNVDVWTMMSFGGGNLTAKGLCTNETKLQSDVMILCDGTETPGKFTLVYYDPDFCRYQFQLRTSAFCGSAPGIGGWSIFIIIIFVGFLVYFLAGFLYLRFVIHAHGIDQIPNRLFWIGVGNKLADGCGAVCRCERFCGEMSYDDPSSISSSYSPIGEGNQQQQQQQQPPFRSQPVLQHDAPLLHP